MTLHSPGSLWRLTLNSSMIRCLWPGRPSGVAFHAEEGEFVMILRNRPEEDWVYFWHPREGHCCIARLGFKVLHQLAALERGWKKHG